jgi:DNA repair exonuclease SbcCD ATPase subunit
MILHSISVTNWRCFLNEITMGPFDEGLNIIHAPNGTGKSTLFEAMRRALLDGYKVSGREVEALRPWGRAVTPRVIIEFSHGGVEYRLAKQFLDNPSVVLERKENGHYQRIAEGNAADEQVRNILTKNPPGRGLARIENWGLAQILWTPQGNLALVGLSNDLVSDIRSMLSSQIAGSGSGPIEKKIEERYLTFYSPKGKLKTGKDAPLLIRLQQELEEARDALRIAKEGYATFEETVRGVEDFRARRTQAGHEAAALNQEIANARMRAEKYRVLCAEKEQRLQQVRTTEAQYKELKQRIEIIISTEQELEGARKTVKELDDEIPLQTREVMEREKDVAQTKANLEDARKVRTDVDRAEDLAETARRFIDCRKTLSAFDTLLGKIRKAEETLAQLKNARAGLVAPDAQTLRMFRKVLKERDEAQLKIEASLITLEIVPMNDGKMEVIAGENIGEKPLTMGTPTHIRGSPEVVADLPGIARLRAWGPTGSIAEHRQSKTEAEKKLKELIEPFGAADLDVLEAMSDKAAKLDNLVNEAEIELATLLGERDLRDIVQEQTVQDAVITRILVQYPEWKEEPPDFQNLKSRAEEIKLGFISRVEGAEVAWEKAQSAHAAAVGKKETVTQRYNDARKLVNSLEIRIAEYLKDGKSMQDREKEQLQFTMEWEAARGRLAALEEQLEKFDDDPVAILEKLGLQLQAALETANHAREQEVREEAKLETLASQGTYTEFALGEERVARLERELWAEQLKVEAIRLLHDTITACRSETITAITRPIEDAAIRIFQRIAGRRFGQIRIGETFTPYTIIPDMVENSVSLDNLSGGELEQLYLATRLALADVVRKGERQLMVLDDVLTATDSGRLARIMNVLEEAAQRLQILILTCHPERYRGLKSGRFLDLQENIER